MTEPKLVRDRIPEMLRRLGLNPVTHLVCGEDYWLSLKTKLQEEVAEFIESEEVEEIADILEVIEAICVHRGIDPAHLADVKEKKRRERGAFVEGIVLESAEPA